MATVADPIIGSWYKDLENNLKFKVVAIDEKDDTIDVQYINGDIGEYDSESWFSSTFDYKELARGTLRGVLDLAEIDEKEFWKHI